MNQNEAVMTEVVLDDGKYIVRHTHGSNLHALRYGEPWRDMAGDGLILALVQKIEELTEQCNALALKDTSLPPVIQAARVLHNGKEYVKATDYEALIEGYKALSHELGACKEGPGTCGSWRETARLREAERDAARHEAQALREKA